MLKFILSLYLRNSFQHLIICLFSIVRELFSQAEQRKPTLVFLDDIEVFSNSKDDVENKITSEFLRQLERLKVTDGSDVLVVGMTNKPWKLDSSILQW